MKHNANFNVTLTLAQVWRAQRTFHSVACVIFMRSCCVVDSPRLSLHFLLSTFPPIAFFVYCVFSFFFHDVEDTYPVHSRQ